MSETAHWLEFTAIVAGGLLVLVLGFVWGRRSSRLRTRRMLFVCPKHNQVVEANLVQDRTTGKWTGVTSCTAFANPEHVRCDKLCVELLNRGIELEQRKPAESPGGGDKVGTIEPPAPVGR
jgi:hypothetical protein